MRNPVSLLVDFWYCRFPSDDWRQRRALLCGVALGVFVLLLGVAYHLVADLWANWMMSVWPEEWTLPYWLSKLIRASGY